MYSSMLEGSMMPQLASTQRFWREKKGCSAMSCTPSQGTSPWDIYCPMASSFEGEPENAPSSRVPTLSAETEEKDRRGLPGISTSTIGSR